MVTVTATYQGDLCCTARHGPSDNEIRTDAPVDNEGLGRFFSPTDMVGAAMATCQLTIMGIVARRHGIPMEGATARVVKGMVATPRRRIGSLPIVITVPGKLTSEQKTLLENAARGCPVHASLHPDVDAPISFDFPND